jgi:serine/threonine-protein kinase PpkA
LPRARAPRPPIHGASSASHEYANYGADRERDGGIAQGRDKWVNTSPVRSFPANDFGLYDMHGNLYEWVEDCYEQKPSLNQRPMQRSGCTNYVLRGGSWFDAPRWIRSADRYYGGVNQRNENFGIRVARDL